MNPAEVLVSVGASDRRIGVYKLFQVDEADVVAAKDAESAIRFHDQLCGYYDESWPREDGYPFELSAEAMAKHRHAGNDDDSDPRFPCSFAAALAHFLADGEGADGEPFMFASTEW